MIILLELLNILFVYLCYNFLSFTMILFGVLVGFLSMVALPVALMVVFAVFYGTSPVIAFLAYGMTMFLSESFARFATSVVCIVTDEERLPARILPAARRIRRLVLWIFESRTHTLIGMSLLSAYALCYIFMKGLSRSFRIITSPVPVILSLSIIIFGITTEDIITFLPVYISQFQGFNMPSIRKYWKAMIQAQRRRRFVTSLLVLHILQLACSSDLLVARHKVNSSTRVSRAKVLRSMTVAFVRFVEGVRLPQMFRDPGSAGFTTEEANEINGNINKYFEWLQDIGYPVSDEIGQEEPVLGLLDGKFDFSWMIQGTNWRIAAPQIKMYAQTEFRSLFATVEEYRPTFSYMTVDNQLASISRYFYNPQSEFPDDDDLVDAIWDVISVIYENSRITPVSYIYKAWNKKFNVGVFATSHRKNARGGFRKLSRKEWIQQVGGRNFAISAFETMAKFGLVFDTYAQFFTKREWLKPKKWMNDIVRTPVAAMLPEYLSQMVVSADPNKRFEWKRTPIKLGMPMNAWTFDALWTAHSRFKLHYAGDCTAFDSTIVGPVIKLIKQVRKKGFSAHKDYAQIAAIIDVIYDRVETAKLVSSTTGNVYKKGSGLMTGHASTSPDNSLVMTSLYLVAWKVLTGRSAKEFKHYNELSVYGDDHVLSISEFAPAAWNWNSIVHLMSTWGITMREEVPSEGKGLPLNQIPFLKKYCKAVPSSDIPLLREILGDRHLDQVTYHDRESLLGKMIAPQLTRDARYKAKRLQSFLYLCAHNEDIYKIGHSGLETIFKAHPNVRLELGKYTPSYKRVLEVWYTSKLKKDVIELDDDVSFEEYDDALILYGEISSWESMMNAISLIPDLVNPALRNVGPIKYLLKIASPALSWPKELIARSNKAVTPGHIESLIASSCYDWLDKCDRTTCNANTTSLLVRHWLYCLLSNQRSYSIGFFITGLFSKLISGNFLLNGFIATSRPKFALSYYNLFLTMALSQIHVPEIPFVSSLLVIRIPDVAGFVEDWTASFLALFFSRIPSSFADVPAAIMASRKLVISAPTGSGKSTDLVESIRSALPANVKLYVVEPRVGLCVGIARYMSSRFVTTYGYITGEGTWNESASVIYISTGSFLNRYGNLFGKGNFFMVDEFHLQEALVATCRDLLIESDERCVFASATEIELGLPIMSLPDNRQYVCTKVDVSLGPQNIDIVTAYRRRVLELCRASNPWMKHVIFVDSFNELEYMVRELPGRSCEISSRRHEIDPLASFYVCTSAADVGLTIPSADIIVSKNCTFDGQLWRNLPPSLVVQRQGRGGRTNNSTFFYVEYSGPLAKAKESSIYESLCVALQYQTPYQNLLEQSGLRINGDAMPYVVRIMDVIARKPEGFPYDRNLTALCLSIFVSEIFSILSDMEWDGLTDEDEDYILRTGKQINDPNFFFRGQDGVDICHSYLNTWISCIETEDFSPMIEKIPGAKTLLYTDVRDFAAKAAENFHTLPFIPFNIGFKLRDRFELEGKQVFRWSVQGFLHFYPEPEA